MVNTRIVTNDREAKSMWFPTKQEMCNHIRRIRRKESDQRPHGMKMRYVAVRPETTSDQWCLIVMSN